MKSYIVLGFWHAGSWALLRTSYNGYMLKGMLYLYLFVINFLAFQLDQQFSNCGRDPPVNWDLIFEGLHAMATWKLEGILECSMLHEMGQHYPGDATPKLKGILWHEMAAMADKMGQRSKKD